MKQYSRTLITLLLILLAGCTSKPSNFYILMPLHGDYKQRQSPTIGLGPITIAGYLDRPQIVTRLGQQAIKINEYHRWGEELSSNIKHVLQQNLQQLTPTTRVHFYPWPLDTTIDYQITVNITRFDTDSQGNSVLLCHWKIMDKDGKKILQSHTSRYTNQTDPESFAAITASMNSNLTKLSRRMAAKIKTLYAGK